MTIEEKKTMMTKPQEKSQTLSLHNRKNLSVNGVYDVESFSDSVVLADTSMGKLSIKGKDLKITKLDTMGGELSLEGKINSLEYFEKKEKVGFFESIFK